MNKKISWIWRGKKYIGSFIRETEKNIFARTTKGKIKTIKK
jgi:hypothetical protein